ncbi:probable cytochrome P450 CYP44 [Ostrea edulis]|uniref:probable cytochrome P450 CYP44 n=1 Tax=Ostrea edulis TaxID=37623 RepID=UPI002094F4DC|nr:probable cytochrome P450 CYP44 [Ostrea edulis]
MGRKVLCSRSNFQVKLFTGYCHRWMSVATAEPNHAAGPSDSTVQSVKPYKDIPGPKGLPYLGTILHYRKGPFQKFSVDRYQDALISRYKEYGPIVKENIAGITSVRIFDPDDVRTVFLNEDKQPHVAPLLDTTKQYREQRNLSPGLGNTNGEEWYRLRSAVQQMMMRPKAVTVYLPFVEEVVNDFTDRIKKIRNSKGEIENFNYEAAKWNLESSGMTCFETRLGCLVDTPTPHIHRMITSNNAIFELSTKINFSVPLHKIFTTKLWQALLNEEDYFFRNGQKLVDETVGRIDNLQTQGRLEDGQFNFLLYLLSKKELSFKDVSIITLSLFGDGLNTTVPTLLFAMYCIAKNPEVQQKAYEEVREALKDGQPITGEHINKMTYLKACVKESQRILPIGLEIKRILKKDLILGGYLVPAGTIVELAPYVHYKSPDYFVEPDRFLPERWLRDGSALNIHPYLLTPFGHGPRMCAGRRFAEQELYVLLSKMLMNFKLEFHGDLDMKFQVLMVPDRPATFTFKDRLS